MNRLLRVPQALGEHTAPSRRVLSVGALTLALCASSQAQTTYCIGTTACPPGGLPVPGNDLSIVTTAAAPGDTIIVGAGSYSPFSVLSRDLTIQPEFFGGTFTVDATIPSLFGPATRCVEIIGAASEGAFIDGMEVINGSHPTLGGGIYIEDSDPVLSRISVHDNLAGAPTFLGGTGGGIAIVGESSTGDSPTIQNSFVFDNDASDGGGIWMENTAPLISATQIYRNGLSGVMAANGGGVWATNSAPTFLNCEIYDNFATAFGGGVYVQADSEATVLREVVFEGSSVHNNATDSFGAGGGIHAAGGLAEGAGAFALDLTILKTEVFENDSYDGGGLYTTDRVGLSIDYGRFDDNTAENDGGGAYIDFPSGDTIVNSQFKGNSAQFLGGGLYLGGSSDLGDSPLQSMLNCLITGNSAFDGGGLWVSAELSMLTSTVDGNAASMAGGGLYLASSGPVGTKLNSSIFYSNTATNASDYTEQIFNAGGSLATEYLDWDNGTTPASTPPPCTGLGCFNDVPQYATGPGVDPWQSDKTYYHDQALSKCVGAGDPSLSLTAPPYVTATTNPTHAPDVAPADVGFHYNGAELPTPTGDLVLSPSVVSVSALAGAALTVNLSITAPVSGTPSTWVVGGSATGTYPGFFYSGVVLPLLFDSYSQLVLNGGVVSPVLGPLDSMGMGATSINLPAGAVNGGFVGLTFYHAFLILDSGSARDASNPAALSFVP